MWCLKFLSKNVIGLPKGPEGDIEPDVIAECSLSRHDRLPGVHFPSALTTAERESLSVRDLHDQFADIVAPKEP